MVKQNKVLIITDWYSPAYKAGGPITSIRNLVKLLNKDFEIDIYTSAYDYTSNEILPNIQTNSWQKLNDSVRCFYTEKVSQTQIKDVFRESNPQIVYFNSMFSFRFTLLPLITAKKIDVKKIMAPRGMLAPSALNLKKRKKSLFLFLIKQLGILNKFNFHATSEGEATDIKRVFSKAQISIVSNVPNLFETKSVEKKDGELRLLFIGRIAPEKNLEFALNVLKSLDKVQMGITMSIIGEVYDENYNSLCQSISDSLVNIKVEYLGSRKEKDVIALLAESHVLLLPTRGENFGHAIVESLSMGRPVITSSNTPWTDLKSNKAGADISLDHPQEFTAMISKFNSMQQLEFNEWSENSARYIRDKVNLEDLSKSYQELFGIE